jgi:hypothetical protein
VKISSSSSIILAFYSVSFQSLTTPTNKKHGVVGGTGIFFIFTDRLKED